MEATVSFARLLPLGVTLTHFNWNPSVQTGIAVILHRNHQQTVEFVHSEDSLRQEKFIHRSESLLPLHKKVNLGRMSNSGANIFLTTQYNSSKCICVFFSGRCIMRKYSFYFLCVLEQHQMCSGSIACNFTLKSVCPANWEWAPFDLLYPLCPAPLLNHSPPCQKKETHLGFNILEVQTRVQR